jgi:hypothetical protein
MLNFLVRLTVAAQTGAGLARIEKADLRFIPSAM